MKPLSAFTSRIDDLKWKNGSKRNERGDILEKFLVPINASREKAGYKPMTIAGLNNMLRFVETKALYAFYGYCNEAKNFSAAFWGRFKEVKNKQ